MRLIIAGSRYIESYTTLLRALKLLDFTPTEVLCGCADGVDSLGAFWARSNSIPLREFRPDWATFGKAAGPYRNAEMAQNADALLIVWDGKSRGSANMKELAVKRGLKVYEYLVEPVAATTPPRVRKGL